MVCRPGLFSNQGSVCYVVRVSNATYATLPLKDDSNPAKNTIILQARTLGTPSPTLRAKVTPDVHRVDAALYNPTANVTSAVDNTIIVDDPDDAASFRPGDKITWQTATVTPVVERVQGTTIYLTAPLATAPAANVTIRLAVLKDGDRVFRVDLDGEKLGPGSVISLEQGQGANKKIVPTLVVKSVTAEKISPTKTTYRVELRTPLPPGDITTMNFANKVSVLSHEFHITVQGAQTRDYQYLGINRSTPTTMPACYETIRVVWFMLCPPCL